MTSIRKLLFFVLAMAVAAFALPAVAHDNDDSFSVVIAPGTVAGTFTAKITSLERSDDEKIRSFKISVPLGGSISSATLSGTGSFSNATRVPAAIPPATADVTFKNVTIRYNQYIIVTMTAALPGATSCGSTNLNWKAYAWEGSNATGDQHVHAGIPDPAQRRPYQRNHHDLPIQQPDWHGGASPAGGQWVDGTEQFRQVGISEQLLFPPRHPDTRWSRSIIVEWCRQLQFAQELHQGGGLHAHGIRDGLRDRAIGQLQGRRRNAEIHGGSHQHRAGRGQPTRGGVAG